MTKNNRLLEQILMCEGWFYCYIDFLGQLITNEGFIFLTDKSVLEDSLKLMHPQFDKNIWMH